MLCYINVIRHSDHGNTNLNVMKSLEDFARFEQPHFIMTSSKKKKLVWHWIVVLDNFLSRMHTTIFSYITNYDPSFIGFTFRILDTTKTQPPMILEMNS